MLAGLNREEQRELCRGQVNQHSLSFLFMGIQWKKRKTYKKSFTQRNIQAEIFLAVVYF